MIEKFLNLNLQNKPQIAIIGDSVLDQYYDVDVSRINPESPTTIFQLRNNLPTEIRFGGCGNIVMQLKYFNCTTYLCSPVDKEITNLFDIDFSYCHRLTGQERIPRKIRYTNNNQVLQRLDIEDKDFGSQNIEHIRKHQLKLFEQLVSTKKIDVVILSDYNKGLFDKNFAANVIRLCKQHNIISIVDPKKYLNWWKNCDIIKPNLKEALCLTKKTDAIKATSYIKNKLKCSHVIITQSDKAPLVDNKEIPYIQPHNIKSTIGAGDTFIGLLSLALSHKFTIQEASYIAHYGGILYVKNYHNKPLHPLDFYNTKLVNPTYLTDRNFSLIATNGCFDILHVSHINLFKYAKGLADKLVVLLNTDESIQVNKGPKRPIVPLEQRIKILESIDCIDYIVPFNEKTPSLILKNINADFLIKGGDYKLEDIIGKEFVKHTYIFPYEDGNSTTNLINKIRKSYDMT